MLVQQNQEVNFINVATIRFRWRYYWTKSCVTARIPWLQEEILRLRNENVGLKAFVAKREDDSIQLMEEKLDDVDRLGKKFKEQYLLAKTTMGNTQNELQACFNKLSIHSSEYLATCHFNSIM